MFNKNKKNFLILTLSATLAACAGSESSYDVGKQAAGQQQTGNPTQGQQTSEVSPVSPSSTPFDPAQALKQDTRDQAATDADCKIKYSAMEFSRAGMGSMHYTLALTRNAKELQILVQDYDFVKLNKVIILNETNKDLFTSANLLLNGELEIKNTPYDHSNVSTHIDLVPENQDCGDVRFSQPIITTAGHTQLFEELQLFIISKIAPKTQAPQKGDANATDVNAGTDVNAAPTAPVTPAKQPDAQVAPATNTPASKTETPAPDATDKPPVPAPTAPLTPANSAQSPVEVSCADLDLTGSWSHIRKVFVNGVEIKDQATNKVKTEYLLESKDDLTGIHYAATQTTSEQSELLSVVLNPASCVVAQTNSKDETVSYKITSLIKNGDKKVIEYSTCTDTGCVVSFTQTQN